MNDTKLEPDFELTLYPRCDQGSPPSSFDMGNDAQRKREFLAAYYRINECYRALLAARNSPQDANAERVALQAIEAALLARDAIEDKYASVGVVATPEFENGFIRNVNFSQPPRPVTGSSLSMLFAVPPSIQP